MSHTTKELTFTSNNTARLLYGDLNRNLHELEKNGAVTVKARGTTLTISGQEHNTIVAAQTLEQLYHLIEAGYPVYPQDVAYGLHILEKSPRADLKDIFLDQVYITSRQKVVSPKSLNQKKYIDAIRNHDIAFGIGPAGTGKTYLAVAMAVAALTSHQVQSIILTRPAVEAGERLGFLPGDLAEKINPYLRPLLDALYDMLGYEKTKDLIEQNQIEIAPLAFMRGRTLNNAFVILDEAQNTTYEQMKMFLTRLGFNSQAVITGDITQVDLPNNQLSGLISAQKILKNVEGLDFTIFSDTDVVRHPLVQAVIRAYDKQEKKQKSSPMTVLLRNDYRGPHHVCLDFLQATAEELLLIADQADQELSLLLLDDLAMTQLNHTWRHKNKPTNVLSFPMEENGPATMLGDIVISIDTAAREARDQQKTLHSHLRSLLIHGFVHLLGYDHERSDHDALEMFNIERQFALHLSQRKKKMVQLAINVDHVATLRQARGISEPDPVTAAALCELAGAVGIVVHLREDRRHIQDRDVRILRETVQTKLNLEMGAAEEIIAIALDLKPDMVTLVPEKRAELTTEGGLDVAGQQEKLTEVIGRMTQAGIPVSLFIDPDKNQIKASKEVGATFVEIHTGRYADATSEEEQEEEFQLIAAAAEEAYEAGLRVNAGHGLNYVNAARVAAIPFIEELSIGHAVMARAIFVGIDQAVREMKEICTS